MTCQQMPATEQTFFHGVFMNLNITDAFEMAAKAHEGQKRKFDGSSYIAHLNEVFNILAYAGVEDEDIFIAGILHDTLEDTSLTEADIQARFGNKVLLLVQSLSDDKSLILEQRKALAVAKVKVLSSAALTIKLADLISNMSAIPTSWDEHRVKAYMEHCRMILEAASQNPHVNGVSQKLIKLAEFFLQAQTEGCDEYTHLCKLAEQGLLYWFDEEQYFVAANHFEGSNEACKLVRPMLEDSFCLGLLRGIALSNRKSKLMSITWEQVSESDDPLIYGTPKKAACQRIVLKI